MNKTACRPQQSFFFQERGVVFNLMFFLYALLVEPWLRLTLNSAQNGQSEYLLGIVLLIVLIIDLPGYLLKTPAVYQRLYAKKRQLRGECALFLLWCAHAVITVFLLMFMIEALGISQYETLMFVLICIAVLKELGILGILWSQESQQSTTIEEAAPITNTQSIWKEFLGEICLFIYSVVAFTATWGAIAADGSQISAVNVANPFAAFMLIGMNMIMASILFLAFFLPLRLHFLFEEWNSIQTRRQMLRFFLSLIVNVAVALKVVW